MSQLMLILIGRTHVSSLRAEYLSKSSITSANLILGKRPMRLAISRFANAASSDGKENNPAPGQRERPKQIEVDPSAPQKRHADPFVNDDGDGPDCRQHRAGVQAECSKGDRNRAADPDLVHWRGGEAER